jgi:hypothetical protein
VAVQFAAEHGVGNRVAALFHEMTPKQRAWLGGYVATGDALATTKTIYKCKSDRNAKVMSYELRRHPNVKAILSILAGKSEREIYLEKLAKDCDAAEPGSMARYRMHALYAQVAFGVSLPDKEIGVL